MVILQNPADHYRVVVTVETEKYNLLAQGYTDVSAQVVEEVLAAQRAHAAEQEKQDKDSDTDEPVKAGRK